MTRLARAALLCALGLVVVGARPVQAQDATAVQAPIAALDDALIAAAKAGRQTPFPSRFQALAPVVERAFDLPAILQTSVGLTWPHLPADQQQALLAAFRRFTVATYVANFDNYDGQRFEMLPGLRSVGNEQVVQTRLVPARGDATQLDYVMRQGAGGWQAVDVLLQGSISRVAVQRSDFRQLLSSGNAGPLIQSLQRKVAELSGGSLQ
ncbi:MAG: ABC transporter substrate-binding protein [Acidisphaera sp.]|nr:ABC transporter substrate-binding protein [Acidisphaera sp.]